MDAHDEHDDPQDDDDVTVHRERAREMLDKISRQVKEALCEQSIDIDLFFLAPNSGEAILIYGTPGDPDDVSWNRVAEVVGSIVAQSIGLDGVRCRPVMCATTDSIADQPSQQTVQPTGQSGCCSMPMHAGADR